MTGERLVHAIDRVTQNHLCGVGPGLGTDALNPGMEITCSLCRVVMTMAAAPKPDATATDIEALGDIALRHGHAEWDRLDAEVMAAVILSSDWFTQRLAKAKASGLREAADDIVTDWAPVWGGPGMWFTTGNAVAELVADTLRSMATEIEP